LVDETKEPQGATKNNAYNQQAEDYYASHKSLDSMRHHSIPQFSSGLKQTDSFI